MASEVRNGRTSSGKPRVMMAPPLKEQAAQGYRTPAFESQSAQAVTYDSYEPYKPNERRAPSGNRVGGGKKKKKKFPLVSLIVIILCSALIAVALYLVAPMLLNGASAPYTLVNGFLLHHDAKKTAEFDYYQQLTKPYLNDNAIFPGIYIDNNHMGGKTIDEARQILGDRDVEAAQSFKVTVNIGNKSWPIDSTMVPLSRNIEQVLNEAFAYGRQYPFSNGKPPYLLRTQLARDLREEAGYVKLSTKVTYDPQRVRELTDAITAYVNRPAIDSMVEKFDFVRKTFTFTDEAPGVTVDPELLYREVVAKLDSREPNAVLTYEPVIVMPTITKAQMINEYKMISTFTTETTSNSNRNTNVRLSADAINGRAVMPGEVFSFNETTGQRTEAKGYKEAIAIAGGQSVPDIGGGVCQTSGTLFNAVARADLQIVYRSPHAWPSTYVPKGMDATVNWPNLDFKFKNNKDTPIYIVAYYADRHVTVEIFGKSLGEGISIDLSSEVTKTMKPPSDVLYVRNTNLAPGTSKATISPRTGYEVATYKIWYQNGQEIKNEHFFDSTYRMYQRTVEFN